MRAKDVMTRSVVTVGPETDVRGIARLLIEWRISAVPILDDNGRVVGIVSEGDLMRRPECGTDRRRSWWLGRFADNQDQAFDYVKTHGLRAKDVMTRKVVSVTEDVPLNTVATLLEHHHIKRVPVLRNAKLVGIVSRADLLHGLIEHKEASVDLTDECSMRAAVLRAIGTTGAGGFINAVVRDGVAYLSGMVDSEVERDAVHIAVERTPGVACILDEVGIFPRVVRAAMWCD